MYKISQKYKVVRAVEKGKVLLHLHLQGQE